MFELLNHSQNSQGESSGPLMVEGLRTGLELVKKYNLKSVVGLRVNGELRDLPREIPENAKVEIVDADSADGLEFIRHSSAHILAQAVKRLYPEVQVTIGPVIENGFYYDFAKEGGFKEEELPKIEKEMQRIIKARFPIEREEWTQAQAIEYFKNIGEHYKCEIIRDLGESTVSVYRQGDFLDLCRGPHVPTTGHVPAIKLTHVAGAYWRGDEKNPMLARIYGTAFASREALDTYIKNLEEAKKRDHRKLGSALGLFSFHPEAPAAPFFHPSGAFVYTELTRFLADLNRHFGFSDVVTPLVLNEELWKKSGHYDNYRENMYFTKVDDRDFAIKPMNCPGHVLIFGAGNYSYRDLPVRFAEFGRVHRHERSGVTAGLFRVRSFVQDDAHVFCSEDQIESEIGRILKMIGFIYQSFGFEYHVELSTRPEKRIGSDEVWDKAEGALERSLKAAGLAYKLNPGDGAFYGPKIDCHLKDSLGRTHQCGTVQLDFSMPARFGLSFAGSDNQSHQPVMIHRAIVGSLERFLGILIEHVAGHFPLWLAPRQVSILTILEDARPWAEQIFEKLKKKGYRVSLDASSDTIGKKIRNAQLEKFPYMIVLGAEETQEKTISVRYSHGEQKNKISLDQFESELAALCQRPVFPNLN